MAQVLINIDVDDLNRAVTFYQRAFGLTIGRRFGPHAVELMGGDAPICLLAKPGGSRATAVAPDVRNYERHWTPVHLDFVVDDLDVATRTAIEAGATKETDVRAHTWGRIAVFSDPFGHGFCLLQFLGKGYDEIAD